MSDSEDSSSNDNVLLQTDEANDKDLSQTSSNASRQILLSPVPPPDSRPSSTSSTRVATEDNNAAISKAKVLPPIKTSAKNGSEEREISSAGSRASSAGSSMASASAPASATRRPRILSYKREVNDRASVGSAGSRVSGRAVSFAPKRKTPRSSEVMVRKNYDGDDLVMVTMETQTDFTWLDGASPSAVPEEEPMDDLPQSDEEFGSDILDTNGEVLAGHTTPAKTPQSTRSGADRSTSKLSQKSILQVSSSVVGEDDSSPAPYPDISDQYGIPMLQFSSDDDSDDSSDESTRERPTEKSQDPLLPSIGPPQILQYQRESEKKEDQDETDDNITHLTEEEITGGMFEGKCEFCESTIKPFPMPEMQETMPPESLYCCNDYREFVQEVLTHPLHQKHKEDVLINVKPHAAYGSKQARRAARERAAQRMRERELARQQKAQEAAVGQSAPANFYAFARQMKTINFQLSSQKCLDEGWTLRPPTPLNEEPETEIFIPEPVPPPWIRQATTLTPKRQGSPVSKPSSDLSGEKSMQRINSFVSKKSSSSQGNNKLSKQGSQSKIKMRKSKHKSRSRTDGSAFDIAESAEIIDEGVPETNKGVWTFNKRKMIVEFVDPEEIGSENEDMDDAFAPAASWFSGRPLVEKYYPDGSKFLTMFPDGTGNVFYPSGNIGIVVSSTAPGLYTYIVMDDAKEKASIIALFEPNGRGVCYHRNGVVRVLVDQIGGVELDEYGARRRKWSWKEQITHVHAPPLQPLCFAITRNISIRIMKQEQIVLTLSAKQRSCRFSVGARLRVVASENLSKPPISENQLFIAQVKSNVDLILHKVSNLLKFPKSPKLEKLPTPTHLKSQLQRATKLKSLKSAHA